MQEDLTYPYNRDSFLKHYEDYAFRLFSGYDLVPQVSKANLRDAFTIWQDENFRWACSFGLRNDSEISGFFHGLKDGDLSDPSHLKKASALCCAINRTKPILQLNEVNYQDGNATTVDFDAPGVKPVTLFPNEFFAFKSMLNYVVTDESVRTDIAPLRAFECHVGGSFARQPSQEYVTATCRYLRLRSPSPSSIYHFVRSLTHEGFEWRRLNR